MSESTPMKLLTRQEAADLLQVCTRTLDKLVRDGSVTYFKVGNQYRFPSTAEEILTTKKTSM